MPRPASRARPKFRAEGFAKPVGLDPGDDGEVAACKAETEGSRASSSWTRRVVMLAAKGRKSLRR